MPVAAVVWDIVRLTPGGPVDHISDPALQSTTFTYSPDFHLQTVTDVTNRVTTFSYDTLGDLRSIQLPDGRAIQLDYLQHQLVRWTNPDLNATTFIYDGCRHLQQIITPEGETTTFAYPDLLTRVMVDAKLNTTTFALDSSGNITQVFQPEGITTNYVWDSLQRLIRYVDGEGHTTTLTYAQMLNLSSDYRKSFSRLARSRSFTRRRMERSRISSIRTEIVPHSRGIQQAIIRSIVSDLRTLRDKTGRINTITWAN